MRFLPTALLSLWTIGGIIIGLLVIFDQQSILKAAQLASTVNRVTGDPFEGMFVLMNLLILWLGGVIFLSTLTLASTLRGK
jgi:hypothetical protein